MNVAVCVITKSYLPCDMISFVDHYKKCGFDHIFVYDHESKYNVTETLKNYEDVTVEFISDEQSNKTLHIQQDLYERWFLEHRHEYDWMICVDDDEFLWLNNEMYSDIKDFITQMNAQGKRQILLPCQLMSYDDYHIPHDRYNPVINECFYTLHSYFKHRPICCYHKSLFDTSLHVRLCNNHVWVNAEHFTSTEYEDMCEEYAITHEYDFTKVNAKLLHYRRRSYTEWNDKINRNDISFSMENCGKRLEEYFDEGKQMQKGFFIFYDPFNKENEI